MPDGCLEGEMGLESHVLMPEWVPRGRSVGPESREVVPEWVPRGGGMALRRPVDPCRPVDMNAMVNIVVKFGLHAYIASCFLTSRRR